jgi:hypothetical protein
MNTGISAPGLRCVELPTVYPCSAPSASAAYHRGARTAPVSRDATTSCYLKKGHIEPTKKPRGKPMKELASPKFCCTRCSARACAKNASDGVVNYVVGRAQRLRFGSGYCTPEFERPAHGVARMPEEGCIIHQSSFPSSATPAPDCWCARRRHIAGWRGWARGGGGNKHPQPPLSAMTSPQTHKRIHTVTASHVHQACTQPQTLSLLLVHTQAVIHPAVWGRWVAQCIQRPWAHPRSCSKTPDPWETPKNTPRHTIPHEQTLLAESAMSP